MDFKSLMPFGRPTGLARAGSDDPFLSLRREMDRLFDSFTRDWPMLSPEPPRSGVLSPRMNVAETATGLEITAELPGVDAKDISLDLTDGVLTLKAEHKAEKDETDEKKQYHVVERAYGTFLRRFALPFEADEEKIAASFEKGVLRIEVPRAAEPEKPVRKIEIKGTEGGAGNGATGPGT